MARNNRSRQGSSSRAVGRASAAGSKPLVELNETNPLGSVTQSELVAVADAELWADPELEASETNIAVEGLARIIAARMDHADWISDPKRLAIFLVSGRSRELAGELNAKRAPILNDGSQTLTGKLWVSGPTFVSGYYVALAARDHGALFQEVEAKGVGNRPALVFNPTATDPEIRYYPRGLRNSDQVQRFLVAEKTFTLSALDKVLNVFYEANIKTPDAAGQSLNPWRNGRKYFPRERTEAFLQGWLSSILSVAFRGCSIRFEMPGTEGRCDLLILSRRAATANSWLCHAALELKVLRSLSDTGRSISSTVRTRAIADGLLQAIAYKREWVAKHGMLCCFDMRTPGQCNGNACFDLIRNRAKRNTIQLRRYRLYGSAKDLRAEKYGGQSPAA